MPRNVPGPHENRAGRTPAPKFVTAERWTLLFEARRRAVASGVSAPVLYRSVRWARLFRQPAARSVLGERKDRDFLQSPESRSISPQRSISVPERLNGS